MHPSPPQTQKRRSWLIPAIIALVILIGDVAIEVLGDDLKDMLKPHRKWVWLALAVAALTAIFAAIRDHQRPDELASSSKANSINISQLGSRNVALGRDNNAPIVPGDHNVIATETQGDVVVGDKHTHIYKTPPSPLQGGERENAPSPTANLPHQLSSPPRNFTGRETELNELMRAWQQGETILGLQGMGGVGKTALALKLAESLKDRYPDAQLYLDLRGVSPQPISAAEAMAYVIRAYFPQMKLPEDENELRGLYNSVLHNQRALLLMDNAANRDQVEPLIPSPICALLVTSRQHFSLPGMFAKHLDTMTPQDAVDLLLEFASRIGDQAERLAKLCGYLPLALKLVGGALSINVNVKPADYATELENEKQRLEILDEVDAAINVSYRHLRAELRKRWPSLAVFPDTFDDRAAAVLWQVEPTIAKAMLSELIWFSLVEWDSARERYRLHSLVRIFADKQLNAVDRSILHGRHADHYCTVLAEADSFYQEGGEGVMRGLALFDSERINIQAGHRWAEEQLGYDRLATGLCMNYLDAGVYVLDLRQRPPEHIRWLRIAFSAANQLRERENEAAILGDLGVYHRKLGDTYQAIDYFEQALTIDRELHDPRGEAIHLGNLASAYKDLGDICKSIKLHKKALAIDRGIPNPDKGDFINRAVGLNNLGLAYAALDHSGNLSEAVSRHNEALQISLAHGDRKGEGRAYGYLGAAYAKLKDTDKAMMNVEKAMQIAKEIGDRDGECSALGNHGLIYKDLGYLRKSKEYFERQLHLTRDIGDKMIEPEARSNLEWICKAQKGIEQANIGNVLLQQGRWLGAIDNYWRSLVIFKEIDDRRDGGRSLWGIALALRELGNTPKAIFYGEYAINFLQSVGDTPEGLNLMKQIDLWRS